MGGEATVETTSGGTGLSGVASGRGGCRVGCAAAGDAPVYLWSAPRVLILPFSDLLGVPVILVCTGRSRDT